MKRIVSTNIRLNLDHEADRKAWERLQSMDRKKYKSYSRAVVAALNDHFDRLERLEADPYLETREKEDAFLQRVLDAVERGFQATAPMGGLLRLLQGAQSVPSNTASTAPEISAEQEEMNDAALDFVDSF